MVEIRLIFHAFCTYSNAKKGKNAQGKGKKGPGQTKFGRSVETNLERRALENKNNDGVAGGGRGQEELK